MSAHCNACGADLSYVPDQYPLMRCEPCELRAENKRLRDFVEWCVSLAKFESVALAPIVERADELLALLIAESALADSRELSDA